jgi:hypothetical protein
MVLPTPVPASASIMRGSPSRSRGWKAKAASAANSACVGRASSSPARPSSSTSRARAASGSTGRVPDSPGGAWSSHSGMRPQTSRPEPRQPSRTGRLRSAITTIGAQAQPARPMVSAKARASSRVGHGCSANSANSWRQATCRVAACSAGLLGSGRPSAWARPTADGAVKRAGRTKA